MLNELNASLTQLLGPLGPVIALAGLGLLMVAGTLPIIMKRKPDPLDKLRASTAEARAVTAGGGAGGPSGRAKLRHGSGTDKLEKFAGFLEPQTEAEMSASRMKMTRAGYRGKNAVRTFHASQFALGLTMLILGVAYAMISSSQGEISSTQMIMAVLVPGAAGYYLPVYWVNRRIQTRAQEMQDGFPDALDMLLVCVEAGQSLDQGIIRVSKELEKGYPALSEEFEIVAHEIKAGKEKTAVLRSFGERSGVQDIASFVTVMIQSQTFGTSIADSLRVYSSEMRDKRVMRAEEAANKIPTKMTLGTMMFTVPPLLIILIGPSIHAMLETFKQIGQ
ncbi:type II secretion system F family protein [Phaeovulum sp. W22_SRMD_FR3]|uniref:type II secretion system F family protein n=1 Tax=Phaeovulum sp. W22_SRMD_FR3 TaxID=3240274 RepID=UPI003F98F4A5